jgi:anthranilate synthase component II
MIDNYDSFTYNLLQYFGELGVEVQVFRNDKIDLATIAKLSPEYIVISPGPCTPLQAGISMAVIKHFAGKIPILGVCLGHQSIGQVFNGQVVRARVAMHGKTSAIYHNNQGVFQGLSNPFIATRYHSLVVARDSLPSDLIITAWTQDEQGQMDEIMGLKHANLSVQGVQFHPESILTQYGHDLLRNFLES